MNTFSKWLALASLLLLCLVACTGKPSGWGGPAASANAGATDSSAPISDVATGPVALPQGGGLAGGAYVIDLDRPGYDAYPSVQITVPNDGWESFGFGVGHDNVGIGLWDVDSVFSSQCTDKTKVHPGASIDALVNALEDQQRRVVTKPVDIVHDGAHGVQLELRVSNNIDISACDGGYFDSWTGAKDSTNAGCCRWQQGAGQVDRLWILDVDGTRLVVDANYMPTADAADRRQLFDVVDSIRFEPSSP
jgi:hypothetical protein